MEKDDEVTSPYRRPHKKLERIIYQSASAEAYCTPKRPSIATRLNFEGAIDDAMGSREVLNPTITDKTSKSMVEGNVPKFNPNTLKESDARFILIKKKFEKQGKEGEHLKDDQFKVDPLVAEVEQLKAYQQVLKEKVEAQRNIRQLEEELKQYERQSSDQSEYQTVDSTTSRIQSPLKKKKKALKNKVPKPKESEEIRKLKEEVLAMKQFMATQKGLPIPEGEPLVEEIEKAKVDHNLKVPQLEPFNGTTDPGDYLKMFNGRMNFYGHNDVHKCQLFPTCLQGSARKWYRKLTPRSIDSWQTLTNQFKMRWSSNLEEGKESCALMQVRQKKSETLKDYITRFRQECAEIPHLIEDIAINSLVNGVDPERHNVIIEEYLDRRPRTLREAFQVLEHRLHIQEAARSIRPKGSFRNNERGEKTEWRKEESKREWRGQEHKERARLKNDDEFTKLNTRRMKVLEYLQKDPNYQQPRPMNPDRKINTSKYCEHHKDYGHETERCNQLRELIERQIQNEELQQFLDRAHNVAAIETTTSFKHVDAIFGGHAPGGISKNSQKSYARQVFNVDIRPITKARSSITISFGAEDYHTDLVEPHDDALVITACVGKNKVQKILVDNGSSVDIIFLHAFDMVDTTGYKPDLSRESTLYAFNGHPVPTIGMIELPVIFGNLPHQIVHDITFYIVNLPSMYNVIFGRTTFVQLGAVTSIPQLKMKFPTPTGIGEIRGDQMIARSCYLTTMQQNDKLKITCNNILLPMESFGERLTDNKKTTPEGQIEEVVVNTQFPEKKFSLTTNE